MAEVPGGLPKNLVPFLQLGVTGRPTSRAGFVGLGEFRMSPPLRQRGFYALRGTQEQRQPESLANPLVPELHARQEISTRPDHRRDAEDSLHAHADAASSASQADTLHNDHPETVYASQDNPAHVAAQHVPAPRHHEETIVCHPSSAHAPETPDNSAEYQKYLERQKQLPTVKPLDSQLAASIRTLWQRVTEIVESEGREGRDANRNIIGFDETVAAQKEYIIARWKELHNEDTQSQGDIPQPAQRDGEKNEYPTAAAPEKAATASAMEIAGDSESIINVLAEKVMAVRILSACRGFWFDQNILLYRDPDHVSMRTREMIAGWITSGHIDVYVAQLDARLARLLDPEANFSEETAIQAYKIYP